MPTKDEREPFHRINVAEAKEMVSSGEYAIIDVRNPDEFQSGHMPGSTLIPVNSVFQRREELPEGQEDRIRLLRRSAERAGCRDGRRGRTAGRPLVHARWRHRSMAQGRRAARVVARPARRAFSTLVLWDIDNTLLYTGGAGSIGMRLAFRDLYGVDDAFGKVEFSGRTDTAIFRDCVRMHSGRMHGFEEAAFDAEQARFVDAYIPHLAAALIETRGTLMPGVAAALDALSARDDVLQALGTGNFRRGGELKLRHYRIDHHFPDMPGGFGEDSESRDAMIGAAIERLCDGTRPRVVVIGDTPHDVAAARANGAFALGVATGKNPVDELLACGADAALEDLRDLDRVLAIIEGR